MDDEASVGDRIAYYRKRRGMTQEVLCGLVGGRSTEWLRQIENNKREVDKLSRAALANRRSVRHIYQRRERRFAGLADGSQMIATGPFRVESYQPATDGAGYSVVLR
jgi:transcriptional regulator with XRE-family HTH domain